MPPPPPSSPHSPVDMRELAKGKEKREEGMDFRRLEFNNSLYNRMLLVTTFDNVDMASCCDVFSSGKPHAVMRTIRLSQRGNPIPTSSFPLHPPRVVVCTSRPARTEGKPPQTFVNPPQKPPQPQPPSSHLFPVQPTCSGVLHLRLFAQKLRSAYVTPTSRRRPKKKRKIQQSIDPILRPFPSPPPRLSPPMKYRSPGGGGKGGKREKSFD